MVEERQRMSADGKSRLAKWRRMLAAWSSFVASDPCAVRRRVWRGVPSPVRGNVWTLLLSASAVSELYPPNTFARLCLFDSAADANRNVDEIVRDLPRTFPKVAYFARRNGPGQRALFNVLKAFTSFDAKLGYVQGMGFIAGTLLLHMSEESAFWSLVSMLNACTHAHEPPMSQLFAEGMPLLRRRCFELDRLLAIAAPRLKSHFASEGLHPTMFASHWYTTIHSCGASPEAAARVWDVALAEGPGTTSHRVAIAMLLADADELLLLPFDALVPRVRSLPEVIESRLFPSLDAFMHAVAKAAEVVTHQALDRIADEWVESDRSSAAPLAIPRQ